MESSEGFDFGVEFCLFLLFDSKVDHLRLQEGQTSPRFHFLVDAGDDGSRQKGLALGPLQLALDNDTILINSPALGAPVIRRHTPLEPNAVPTSKLLAIIKRAKSYGIEPKPVSIEVNASAADRLSMTLPHLGRSFDNDDDFGFTRSGGRRARHHVGHPDSSGG